LVGSHHEDHLQHSSDHRIRGLYFSLSKESILVNSTPTLRRTWVLMNVRF
jgi:hypothetical protein